MDKNVYIVNDLVVTLTESEYQDTFTQEQIDSLENEETIEWIDEEGQDHFVRLIKKEGC